MPSLAHPPKTRCLGRHGSKEAGPLLLVIAGIHGNEPGGVLAVRALLDELWRSNLAFKGELVAVAGNMGALAEGVRYRDHDLNRLWTRPRLEAIRRGDPPAADIAPAHPNPGASSFDASNAGAEDAEQRSLLALLDETLAGRDAAVVVDLHSTSAGGGPFVCISDTLRARSLALSLPIPVVLGLEESIHGTLLEYLEREGRATLLLEGGQHDDPSTPRQITSALWLLLGAMGVISPSAPRLELARAHLEVVTQNLPRVVEVIHRQGVAEADRFSMDRGHMNFERVRPGVRLATMGTPPRPVSSPVRGLLLMPLYQSLGSDGFFVTRPVRRPWLGVSRVFRLARVDAVLRRLPGVKPDPVLPHRVLVDPSVARWGTVNLFHLAGFRRLPDRDGHFYFTRRVEP